MHADVPPAAAHLEAPASAPVSHVRPVSDHARQLIADGVTRSPTIARLVGELNASDVIVFIELRVDPGIPTAETMLLTSTRSVRYVHVIVNPRLTLDQRVEYLGHELQHVLEIATDDCAVDGPSVRRRFATIGRELSGSANGVKSFETDEARLVSLAVRRDLARPMKRATAQR